MSTTTVELFFNANNLRDADIIGTSDPMLVVFLKNPTVHTFEEVGRTEVIQDKVKDVKWDTSVILDYSFSEQQIVRFSVYDVDSEDSDLSKHTLLGSAECELGNLIQRTTTVFDLEKGQIIVNSQIKEDSKENCHFEIHCKNLKKMDFLGKSDGFIVISQSMGDGSSDVYQPVHTTEIVDDSTEPKWKPFTLTASELCNSDHFRNLKFECFDSDGPGKSELIGSFTTSLKELENTRVFELKDKKGKNVGDITFADFRVDKVMSFTDCLKAGVNIAVDVAIDFTQSNRDPTDPKSLHYHASNKTQYEAALRAICEVVLPYDSNGSADVYGFGGVFDGNRTSHCHHLGEAKGVDAIDDLYRDTLKTVRLSGPTYFQEIIATTNANASSKKNTYTIMLILTDGAYTDRTQTIQQLQQASTVPVSYIICGIGNDDFEGVEELDHIGENGRFRDVVQFVKWNRFKANPALFAKETLAEIPAHVESYMIYNRKSPSDFS